jgi:hypothetical protein
MWCSDVDMWEKQCIRTALGTNSTSTYCDWNSSQPYRLVVKVFILVQNPITNSAFSEEYMTHSERLRSQKQNTKYFLSMSTYLNACSDSNL